MNEQRMKRYAAGMILLFIMLLGRKTDLWAATTISSGTYTGEQIAQEAQENGGYPIKIDGTVTLSGGTLDGAGQNMTTPVFMLQGDADVTVNNITIKNFESSIFYTKGTTAGHAITLHIGSEGTETKILNNTNKLEYKYYQMGCVVVADIAFDQYGKVDITMDHAQIEGNKASADISDYGYGAGLFVQSEAKLTDAEKVDPNLAATFSVTIKNCTFTGNEARCGGALDVRKISGKSQIKIEDSVFKGNKATGRNGEVGTTSIDSWGGAIENLDYGGQTKTVNDANEVVTRPNVMEIKNTTFEGNTANQGKAGGVVSQADLIMTDCTFTGNTAYRQGGMVMQNGDLKLMGDTKFIENKSLSTDVVASIENVGGLQMYYLSTLETEGTVLFQKNETLGGYGAGGLSLVAGDATLGGTVTLIENKGGYGGGLYYNASKLSLPGTLIVKDNTATERGGGIYQAIYKDITLQNVIVTGNKAANGGGIYMEGSTKLALDSCSVKGNMASENGGGVYKSSGELYLRDNTEISYNACGGTAGGGLYAGADSSNTVNAVQGTVKIADNYMNVSAINNGSTTPTFTYSTGNAASNRSNAYLVYNSDKQYAAFTVDGTLSAGAAFGVTSSDPVSGRIVVKPDGDSRTSLTAADLSYFTHDAKENGTSELKVELDSTAKHNIILASPIVKVNFKNNYSSSDDSDAAGISVEEGKTAGATWPAKPTRTGYLFMGWNTVRSPLTDTSGKLYASDSPIFANNTDVANKTLTLYALWMIDADGNGIPDAMQVAASFKAGANGSLTDPSDNTFVYNTTDKTYTFYIWRGTMTDTRYAAFKNELTSEADAEAAIAELRTCIAAKASLTAARIPGTTGDSGYVFESWTPSLAVLPVELAANKLFTAGFKEDTFTLTLDTHDVYPLLYGGTSSQELSFTLRNGSGAVVTDEKLLKNVTFTIERTDGFETLSDYAVVTLNGTTITAEKSGVVKIHAKYKNVVSSDFAVAVVPGDLDKDRSIQLNDAVRETAILRGAAKEEALGTYGSYLANMNNIPGVDVDDIVKIVSMVRNISDYKN